MFSEKINISIVTTCFLMVLFSHVTFAQNVISTTDFLSSIYKSKQFSKDSLSVALLNEKNYNLPLIKSVQFRLETRQFVDTWQEYSLRIKPNSFRAKSNQKNIYINKIEEVELSYQKGFNEELKKRYNLILEYIFNKKFIESYSERQIQLSDKLEVLSHSIYELNFDVKDLIESEEDLLAVNLKLIQLEKQNKLIEERINQLTDVQINIDFNDLIGLERIIELTKLDSSQVENLDISIQKLKINTLEKEKELSVAKSKQFVDFIQAKYIGKSDNLFEDNISLGFGINLPFFGNTRKEKNIFYFEQINEEYQLSKLEEKVNFKIQVTKSNFETALLNFNSLNELNKKSSISLVYDTYKKMEGVSPILLLKLSLLKNKKSLELLKFEQELYKAYIDYLDTTEILYSNPYVNYISSSLKYLK